MSPLRSRLNALEARHIRELYAALGAPYGLTADEVLDEAMALLALPPDELARELAWLEALEHVAAERNNA
jgi:hypothetical protein